LNALSIQDEVM